MPPAAIETADIPADGPYDLQIDFNFHGSSAALLHVYQMLLGNITRSEAALGEQVYSPAESTSISTLALYQNGIPDVSNPSVGIVPLR